MRITDPPPIRPGSQPSSTPSCVLSLPNVHTLRHEGDERTRIAEVKIRTRKHLPCSLSSLQAALQDV
ncbi:uncharacterized protein SCHCODRAFT_02605528 [Schizophyllum commune H4-8]|uniref:uncharacterized protein n=1 Tax=Schizophyllum commune (strain H4-8 / FGSC 9210) TaxID=578458 RepID=UPI00215FB403|nr:uncharacterized protein SCHCODRAFT_02605528 [Schizophyllum commune H4-8]KAI5899577.1 hypothetical protein SCHCODRAFT_02605528 [Schizophyllum commune H4-8]